MHREMRNAYTVSVGIAEEQSPFGRSSLRWEDNIKMGLRGIWLKNMDWIHVAKYRVQSQALHIRK